MTELGVRQHESAAIGGLDEVAERLLSAAAVADPYPLYEQLRAGAGVHRSSRNMWLISRYAAVASLLRDERASSQLPTGGTMRGEDSEVAKVLRDWMSFADPPNHTRLRGLVRKAFTPRAVASLRPYVEQSVDALVSEALDGRTIDFVEEVAYPLPVAVISELLGVPRSDRHIFVKLTPDCVDASSTFFMGSEPTERGDTAIRVFTEYVSDLIAERRKNPDEDDFLSALISAEEDGERLSRHELIGMVFLLLVAGHETTVHLSSAGLLALMNEPAQWQRLCAEPALAPSAVEELLRFAGSVHVITRFAREDFEFLGGGIAAGEPLLLLLGSANRDEEQFPDGDRLDILRSPNRHLGLGGGIHYCLGAALARLEVETLLGRLASRASSIELAGEPQWRPAVNVRSLTSMPMRLT